MVDVAQLALEVDDPFAQLAAVALKLGLTGAAQTDAADTLPGEVGPQAGQTRQPVFELGQLDLEPPLVVSARRAKTSRISAVRSMTLTSSAFSRLRCWEG